MFPGNFTARLDQWIEQLDKYSFEELCRQPAEGKWSMGQLYVHIIQATHYFFAQALAAASSDDHKDEQLSARAQKLFDANELPDQLIEGPVENASTPQPENFERLLKGLQRLKAEAEKTAAAVAASSFHGKVAHFGLAYFDAAQWLQFSEIHFRHHERQKKRLDTFLGKTG